MIKVWYSATISEETADAVDIICETNVVPRIGETVMISIEDGREDQQFVVDDVTHHARNTDLEYDVIVYLITGREFNIRKENESISLLDRFAKAITHQLSRIKGK